MNRLQVISGAFFLMAMGQGSNTPPPIKMGLWETTSTMKATMPGMDMPPRTSKVRSCYTPSTWNGMLGPDTKAGCTRSNETLGNHKYSFDESCPNPHSTAHIEAVFPDTDTAHGASHVEADSGGRHMVMDRTFDSHFISADCGAVAPGKPEIVH